MLLAPGVAEIRRRLLTLEVSKVSISASIASTALVQMDYNMPEATVIVDEELSLPEGSTALILAVGAAIGAAVVGWCVGKVFEKLS